MLLRALPLALLSTLAFVAVPAPATTAVLNTPDACAGSLCGGYDLACAEGHCTSVTLDCSELCAEVLGLVFSGCDYAPDACAAAFEAAGTPAGACTFRECDGAGAACVQANETVHCESIHVPAACVGTMCDGWGPACVWGANESLRCPSDACSATQVCVDVAAVCPTDPCDVVEAEVPVGACVGSPQSWDPTAPDCPGGIACVDVPPTKLLGDPDACMHILFAQ